MHQFQLILDIVKLETQKDLLVAHLLRDTGLSGLLVLDEPDNLILEQVDLDGGPLSVRDGHAALPRVALLPHVPTVGIVSDGALGLVGVGDSEALPRADPDHDVPVAGLELPEFELVGLAMGEGDVADEGVPDAVVVLLDDDDALVAAVDAEVVPVRVVEEVVQLQHAELLVELLQALPQNADLLTL
jgi:hypothetical protein